MVMGFSPLAAQLDAEGKVRYGVAQMPTNVGTPVTLGVEDYLMAFKKKDNQEAVQGVPRPLLPARATSRAGSRAEGFLPVTDVGPRADERQPEAQAVSRRAADARLAPTTDPTWDRVKLDVQQNIGLAVQPGGDPKQVLERLQKNAIAAGSAR